MAAIETMDLINTETRIELRKPIHTEAKNVPKKMQGNQAAGMCHQIPENH